MVWDKTKVVERGNHKVSRTPELSGCVSLHISPITRLAAPPILLQNHHTVILQDSFCLITFQLFLRTATLIWFGGELCTNFAGNILRVEQNHIIISLVYLLSIISFMPTKILFLFLFSNFSRESGTQWESCNTTAGKTPRNHYFTSFLVYQKQKSIFQPKSISVAKPTLVAGNNWFSFFVFLPLVCISRNH